jgi:hypothetical protein
LPDWARGSGVLLSTVEDEALVEDGILLLGSNEAVVLEAGYSVFQRSGPGSRSENASKQGI